MRAASVRLTGQSNAPLRYADAIRQKQVNLTA